MKGEMMETVNTSETRRGFLKKVAYVAPAIVALGALSIPSNGYAAGSTIVIKVDGNPVVIKDVPADDPISIWGNQPR